MTEAATGAVRGLAERVVPIPVHLPEPLRCLVEAVPLYAQLTPVWAQDPEAPSPLPSHALPWRVQLHLCNFRLWHTENGVRRPEASAQFIAQSKRTIDALNQQRHEHIEQLDTWLLTWLHAQHRTGSADAELHSETPGNLLDRLSILALKVHYMGHEAARPETTEAHRQQCRERLALLCEQRDDLHGCLGQLCCDLWSGEKIFKIYRQFKMYNDPTLNPEIYRYRLSSKEASDATS